MTIIEMGPSSGDAAILECGSSTLSKARDRGRRRSWSTEEKLAIIAEVDWPGETLTTVARRHEMSADHLLTWVERAREGTLGRRMRRTDKISDAVADGGFIDLGTFRRGDIEAMLGGGGMLEIELPGPMRVRLPLSLSPAQLTATVRALKAA